MNGVKFDNVHSYDDLQLILTKTKIGVPSPKIMKIELEEYDGSIDVTNALTDVVFFNNRELQFEFSCFYDNQWYNSKASLILNALNGKKVKITLDDDKEYYYEGRVYLDMNSDRRISSIVVTCDCEPYKYDVKETTKTFNVTTSQVCNIEYTGTKRVCPVINVSASMQLVIGSAYYQLKQGDNIVPDFVLKNGSNSFEFKGTGTAKVTYRGGLL